MYVSTVCAWGIWRTFKALKVVNANDIDGVADVAILAADDERWTMLKYWSVFSVWILYSEYAEWIVAWLPGYTILKLLSIVACFFMPTALRVTDTIFAYCLPPTLALIRYAVHRSIVFCLVFFARLFVFPDSAQPGTKRETNTPYAAANTLFLCSPCVLKTPTTRHVKHSPPQNDADSLEDDTPDNDRLEDDTLDNDLLEDDTPDYDSLEQDTRDNDRLEEDTRDNDRLEEDTPDYDSLEEDDPDSDSLSDDAAEHASTHNDGNDEGLESEFRQHDAAHSKDDDDIDDDDYREYNAADADNRTSLDEVGMEKLHTADADGKMPLPYCNVDSLPKLPSQQ